MWIADAARCREIDRRSIQEFGIGSETLMERAGAAVYKAVREIMPRRFRLTVFCGKGNNGGDGFVVARRAIEDGQEARCLVAARASELSPDSATQLGKLRALDGSAVFYDDVGWFEACEQSANSDVIVDALLGTGASGEVVGPTRGCVELIGRLDLPVVSVDVPSGLDTDSGTVLGVAVAAHRTVTFGLPKPCFFQGAGVELAGKWRVADIGFPPELLQAPTDARLTEADWAAARLPRRRTASHKGDHGHTIVVAGSARMPGAAVLAAMGALRSGAGLVTVAGIESVCRNAAAHLPEVLLLPLPEASGVVAPDAAGVLLERSSAYDSAVFGPGLTCETPVLEFLGQLWPEWGVPSVVDADGLNAVAQAGIGLPRKCVLTPHPGETARLLGLGAADVQAKRFETARQAAERFAATVLLKGAFSVAASPGLPLSVNPTGNPGMAAGGMGDVLAGVVGALLARGMEHHDAATLGMYWHGLAGDLCADEVGPAGFSARDLARRLPAAQAKMLAPAG